MKIATTIGDMYNYVSTPAEAVRTFAGSGFRYLDYSFYYSHKEGSPFMLNDDSLWRKQITETADTAAEYGFSFVQAHLPGYNPMGDFDHERCMRAVLRTAEACGLLKIPTMVIHTSRSLIHHYPEDRDSYSEYNKKFLAPILDVAEKYGTTLCIENTSAGNAGECYFPRTPEEMNALVKFIDHPCLGCCWDTGHACMEGKGDQYNDLQELGNNLKAVHIHDNNTFTDQHLIPYCGKMQLHRVIEALRDMDFKGYFTFEAYGFLNNTNSNPPAKLLPLEIRQTGLKLLYQIARFSLQEYGLYEE